MCETYFKFSHNTFETIASTCMIMRISRKVKLLEMKMRIWIIEKREMRNWVISCFMRTFRETLCAIVLLPTVFHLCGFGPC